MARGFPDYFGELSLPVSVPNGGTGGTSFDAHAVLLGNGSGAIAEADTSTADYVLTSNGVSADPSFKSPVAGTVDAGGLITSTNPTILTPPAAGFYLAAANVQINNVSAGSLKVRFAWVFTQNGVNQLTTPIEFDSTVAGRLSFSNVIGLYCDANTPIEVDVPGVTLGAGDSYDLHARLIKLF